MVLHVAQTNELAIASAQGRLPEVAAGLGGGIGRAGTVDDAAAFMVERERDVPAPVVLDRWQTSVDTMLQVLEQADPHERVQWVAGTLSVHTLTTTRLAEGWIHTGDVATAFDVPSVRDDRLWHIARLAWRTLPYAYSRAGREPSGPVAFELSGPGGEHWEFTPDEPAATIVQGPALELCLVAARRSDPADTSLGADGADASSVLELVRTYA